jgi:hypothetical protein
VKPALLSILFFHLAIRALAGDLPQQVYVWQRAWTPPVRAAVAQHSTNFSEVAVLLAEVSWKDKLPSLTRPDVDFATLAKIHCPIGLVLRIGPFNGNVSSNTAAVNFLAALAASLAAEARAKGIEPAELQIDFDCAESKLDDYQSWFSILQKRVAPLPATVTVLPSWLGSQVFLKLAAISTNYVLQAHSLNRPTDINSPFTLCDPQAAKRAVARAGEIGVPFRVALPTYSYIVAFNSTGKFFGLAAEPGRTWPDGTQLREMNSDPLAMDSLVSFFRTNAPPSLSGIIWYRLPVAVDNLNWRWPTLAAIVAGREPRESFRAAARRVEAGLVEISLVNDGDLDISSRLAVEARWFDARLISGDGLRDFEMAEQDSSAARFQNNQTSFHLPAGETQVIGWLRLDQDREVQLEAKKY